jgi:hypothetical protein
MLGNIYDRINDYGSVKISLASPNDIRSWSFGQLTTVLIVRRKMAYFVNAYSVLSGIGNVPAASIKAPSLRG